MAVETGTVADLGRLVKRKYPAYANIDDVELGRRVKAKYPAYSHFADIDDAPRAAAAPPQMIGTPHMEPRAAVRLAQFRARPRALQLAEQAGAGVIETLPSHRETPLIEHSTPAPEGMAEKIARGAGSALAFGVEAGAVTLSGGTALAAAALPAFAAPGTMKERLVSAGVMGAAGAAAHWIPSAVTNKLLGIAKLQSGPFARSVMEQAERRFQDALKSGTPEAAARGAADQFAKQALEQGARRAAGTVGAATKTAEAVTGATVFGGVAPYAETAALKLLGEEAEYPQMQDLVAGVGAMAAVGGVQHLAGRGARATRAKRGGAPGEASPGKPEAPTGPSAPPAPAPQGAPPPTPGPAARGMAVQPEAPGLQRTQRRAAFVGGLPSEHRKVLLGVLKGLDDTATNPFDNGHTALQGALARIEAGAAAAKTPEQMRKLAAKARKQVKGLQLVNEAMSEPPGGTPGMRQVAEVTAERWTKALAGKPLTLSTETGVPVSGRVVRVANYPWAAQPFRVLLADESTGQVAPLKFNSPTEFRERIVRQTAPQTALPVAGAVESAPTAPQVGGPARKDAGGGKEAAAGPQRAVLPEFTASTDARASAVAKSIAAQYPGSDPRVVKRGKGWGVEVVADAVKEQPAKGGTGTAQRDLARPPERVETPAPQPAAPNKPEFAVSAEHAARVATGTLPRAERKAVIAETEQQQRERHEAIVAGEKALADNKWPNGKTMTAKQRKEFRETVEADRRSYEDTYSEVERVYGWESARKLRAAIEKIPSEPEAQAARDKARAAMPEAAEHVYDKGGTLLAGKTAFIKPPKPSGQERKGGGAEEPVAPAGPRESVEHPPMRDVSIAEMLSATKAAKPIADAVRAGASDQALTDILTTRIGLGGGSTSGRVKAQWSKFTGGVELTYTDEAGKRVKVGGKALLAEIRRGLAGGEPTPTTPGKFKPKERVLVPYEGRSKRMVSDRGVVEGYVERGGERLVHVTVFKGRTGKKKVDRFVREDQIRRRPKADRRPLDEKLAPVYRRMTLEAQGDPAIAAEIVEREAARAKEALEAVRGEPGTASYNRARAKWQRLARTESLARQVQSEAESGPSEGSGLREIAAAVRATGLDRSARSYLSDQIEAGKVDTVDDVAAVARSFRRVLKAAKAPLKFEQVHNAIGRIAVAADRARLSIDDMRATMDKVTPDESPSLRGLLKAEAARLTELRRIQTEAEARAAAAGALKGPEVANELFRVREWLDQQIPQTPEDWGGAVSFMGTGAFMRALGRLIQRGVPRAVSRLRRSAGRGARDARVVDEQGNEQARYSMDEALGDPFTESALMRTAALYRMTGAREAFPPPLARRFQLAYAREAAFHKEMRDKIEWVFGGREGIAYFGMYGTGAKELSKALRGEPHNIPERFRGAIARYKQLIDQIHEMDVAHAKEHGLEVPKKRADYGHAHIIEGHFSGPLPRVVAMFEGRKLNDVAEAEIEDRQNRFYNRREGDPNYVKDATYALEQRIFESVRKWSWDPFLLAAEKYLNSESVIQGGGIDSKTPRGEARRAALAAAHIRAALFRKTDWLTTQTDRGLQHLFFSRLTRGVQAVPMEMVERVSGKTAEELELLRIKKAYWVPGGVEAHIPEDHVVLATRPDGSRYIGLREGHVYSKDSPIPRKVVYDVIDFVTDKFARATFQLKRGSEAELRHKAKVDDWVRRLERNPTDIVTGLWTGGTSRALMGYNVRASHVNAGSTLVTTLPEYGVRAYLAGLVGASKMVQRRALRTMIDAQERIGMLSSADAAAAREAIPVLREELFAEASGVQQGEIQVLERRMKDMMDGKDPDFSRVINATGPFGMFAAAEGWNRTVSIIAAHAYATRLGLPEESGRIYRNSQAAHRAMLRAMGIRNSAEAFAAMGVGVDQFSYNPMGQPLWYTGPWGRLIGQLGTWPLNYAKSYVFRTSAGAINVARASARGFADLASGGRLGRAGKPKLEYDTRSGLNPPPKNWFEAWLDYNGASYSQRHAGATFLRQMAVSAILVGATDATNVNVAVYGVNPVFVAGLYILHRMFPDNEAILRWLKHGTYGATINVSRGITPWGPTVSLLKDVGVEAGRVKKRYEKTGDLMGSFPWAAVLPIVRRQLLTGEVEIRRIVQEHPEKFARWPWLFQWLGIKYGYPGMTKAQRLKHEAGLMTESEEKQARARVAE